MERLRNRYKSIFSLSIKFSHLLIFAVIYSYVWNRYCSKEMAIPYFRRGDMLVVIIYLFLVYIFSNFYGGYKIGSLRTSEVIYSQILSLFFVNVITYFQLSLIARHLILSVPLVVMTLVQIPVIILWAYVSNRIYFRLYPPHEMILVYGSKSAVNLVYKMSLRYDKYRICTAVNADEGLEAVLEKVRDYPCVVICDVQDPVRSKLLKYCFQHSIRVYLTPRMSEVITRSADTIHLFDTPLLLCRNQGMTLEQRIAKRCIDLLISCTGLVLASPFMLLTALAIKLCDHGPVFFKQERLTIGGKVFSVYKFRSMYVNAEKDGVARLASQHDGRITPVGKIIRKVRLDELPQLINVLKGDMSFVGPRPERPEIAAAYQEEMPEFIFRLKVKAGLTGYAQVYGKYNTTPHDKLMMDMVYINSYSLMLDLKLILMTVKILFLPESTEGVAEGAILADETDPSHLHQQKNKDEKGE